MNKTLAIVISYLLVLLQLCCCMGCAYRHSVVGSIFGIVSFTIMLYFAMDIAYLAGKTR